MSIDIQSTTDDQDAINAALGKKSEKVEQETAESQLADDETKDEAATSKKQDHKDDQDSDDIDENDVNDDDDDDENEDDESKDKKPKKRNRVEKRIKKLSKQKNDARAEAEYWREQALKYQQQKPQEKEYETPRTDNNGKPDPDDYDSHEDYIDALTDWKVEKTLSKTKEQERQEKLKEEYQNKQKSFQSKVQEFAQTVEDFEDVINDVDDITMSPAVQQSILESDDGPRLMYELAKDPEEYERICSLTPLQAARAIGRIEAKLSKPEKAEKKETKTTKAPPPVTPVRSKSSSKGSHKSPDEMSFEEYKLWRAGKL